MNNRESGDKMQSEKKSTLKGMWWVKGNESDKFAGILTYGGGYVPSLEIFPKEFDWDQQKVPNNSTIYGDVFGESKKLQAVTLLECKSRNNIGWLGVGAYLYKQEFVSVNCVAIGMHLDDDELAQVHSPQKIYLTCPGLDEYGIQNYRPRNIWKENAPAGPGGAYRFDDLDKSIFTQPEPIVINIDIGSIKISLVRLENNTTTMHYSIEIILDEPMPQDEVNELIYSQILSFISIMAGRRQHIRTHNVSINSQQTRSGSLSLVLNYGHTAYSTQETKHTILQTLLIGSEDNLRMFATLFPKWRENFEFVNDLAFHYLHMVEERTESSLLQSFSLLEIYVLQRILNKNKKGMLGILSTAISSIADYFASEHVYRQHFPNDRDEHIAEQLANFRHNRIHPKSDKECTYSLQQVYAYIDLILRSIFLKEMKYPITDSDAGIGHWQSWHRIAEDEQ